MRQGYAREQVALYTATGKAVAKMPVLETVHICSEGHPSNISYRRPRMDLVFNVLESTFAKQGKQLHINLPKNGAMKLPQGAWIDSFERSVG